MRAYVHREDVAGSFDRRIRFHAAPDVCSSSGSTLTHKQTLGS
jgi:hypothetical protein